MLSAVPGLLGFLVFDLVHWKLRVWTTREVPPNFFFFKFGLMTRGLDIYAARRDRGPVRRALRPGTRGAAGKAAVFTTGLLRAFTMLMSIMTLLKKVKARSIPTFI